MGQCDFTSQTLFESFVYFALWASILNAAVVSEKLQ
jgi:hypothetical protein